MTIIDRKIVEYQGEGWILLSFNNGVAQLRKPKTFGFVKFVLFILFIPLTAGIGSLFLLLDHWTRRDKMILLYCDNKGIAKTRVLSW